MILPPSLHVCGQRYAWLIGLTPHDVRPALPPEWLIRTITGTGGVNRTGGRLDIEHALGDVADGKRNDTATRLMGHLLSRYVDPRVALDLLLCWNAMHCKPPMSEREVKTIANSIAGRELKKREAGRGR